MNLKELIDWNKGMMASCDRQADVFTIKAADARSSKHTRMDHMYKANTLRDAAERHRETVEALERAERRAAFAKRVLQTIAIVGYDEPSGNYRVHQAESAIKDLERM